ncbi:MAG TPA: 30S ribosomal protein S1 [Bryobacteraceae bacterium]|nr:30S ribosomal protein S1 [Bryobacteraceae bacterium]
MTGNEDDRQFEPQDADYEQMLDDYGHFTPPAEGEICKGTVLSVTDKEVIVDFGYKSEGLVPIEQFRTPDGTVSIARGDVIDVMVDRSSERPEGYVLLSHEKARGIRAWDVLEAALRDGESITGRVVAKTRGGLTVDVGVPAFMPSSQVAARPVYNLDSLVGTEVPVKVVKLNRRRGNLVVSRRLAVEQEETSRKSSALETLHEGAVVQGTVKNLTDYGAFIDLGGIDGLLHVSDMSWGRLQHPSELLHVGDPVTVKVLKFDRDKERISLGIKQITENPWETAEERYAVQSRVIGRVVSVTDYGAFVELEPGVEGLIHISEMTWSRRMKHPAKVVHVGDQVEAVVLEVKPKDKRISLGMKQLEADPWTTVADRYSIGSVVEGRVRKLTDFGAFIEIEEGIDGLVHISDLSWTRRVGHPSEILKKGQIVQAVVLNIDPQNRRLSLGVKQLQPDAWESFFSSHTVGDVVRGKVCRASNFGVFVEVAPGVEGLCHNSELPAGPDRRKPSGLPIGEEFDFKVIKLSEGEKKIGLSLRAISDDAERSRVEDYSRQAAAATSNMDEFLHNRGRNED